MNEINHDLKTLLTQISDLWKVSKTLVEELNQEQQRCAHQTQFVASLSRRVQESMSILRGAAWMLDVHGNHIKPETRRKHYSTICTEVFGLNKQLKHAQLWRERMFDLNPMLLELEKFGLSSVEGPKHSPASLARKTRAKKNPRRKEHFDPSILKMILDEILDNALKFSHATKPVECQIFRSEQQVQISVRDYGPGIPDRDKLNIFKSFYRCPSADGIEGYGLGLAIVKKLVSDARGTILLKSKLGKGTEIMISIPLHEAEIQSPASAA